MRRIVFDCDRCGKKDIAKVYSRYDESAFPDTKELSEEEQTDLFKDADYLYSELGASFFQLFQIMEKEKEWRHFCDKCFQKMLASWAGIMSVKKRGGALVSQVATVSQKAEVSNKKKAKKQNKKAPVKGKLKNVTSARKSAA